jgi:CDGSH-type Zn-finger protein
MEKVKVKILDKGPVIIEGPIELIDKNGDSQFYREDSKIALCRCGYSENKPFCDGKHKSCPVVDNL